METNTRTLAMHETFGIGIDGLLRDGTLRDGEFISIAILSILFAEWQALEPRMRASLCL